MKSVRIVFSKTGRIKYVSHLDLVRAMTRAVRRANIPLWYTEGFNKHPYLTFAAPLSLGYEGLRETMDIRMADDFPFDELVKRLPKPFRLIQTLSSPEGDFGDISDGTIMKKDGIRHVVEYLGRGMEETVGIGGGHPFRHPCHVLRRKR